MKGCLCLCYRWVTPLSFCPVEGHQVGNLSPPPFFLLAPVLCALAGCNVQCCTLSPAAVAEAAAHWCALLPGEMVAIATLERINTSTCTRAPLPLTQQIYYFFFWCSQLSSFHRLSRQYSTDALLIIKNVVRYVKCQSGCFPCLCDAGLNLRLGM